MEFHGNQNNFLAVIGLAPSLSLANIGKATNCHVERSETQREVREVSRMTV